MSKELSVQGVVHRIINRSAKLPILSVSFIPVDADEIGLAYTYELGTIISGSETDEDFDPQKICYIAYDDGSGWFEIYTINPKFDVNLSGQFKSSRENNINIVHCASQEEYLDTVFGGIVIEGQTINVCGMKIKKENGVIIAFGD